MSLPGLTLVVPADRLWRIGRRDDPLRFSRVSQTDAALARTGNRFDVPGGGVLYAATTVEGCFAETLARFRPSPAVAAAVAEDSGYMDPGGIPVAWQEDRRLVSFALAAPLPFVDIDDTSTLLALGAQLHGELAQLGVDELDRGGMYSANRRLTRVLASWIYSRTDDDGQPCYGGIRYDSRLGRQWESRAIFDGAGTPRRGCLFQPLDGVGVYEGTTPTRGPADWRRPQNGVRSLQRGPGRPWDVEHGD